MKFHLKTLGSLVMALGLGVVTLSAQSCAAAGNVSNAVGHSVAASGEVVAASAESGAAVVKGVSGVAAVPVYLGGAMASGSGAVLSAFGDAVNTAGAATMNGGEKLWDFASGDPANRPGLDRTHAVPPAPSKPTPPVADPAPGQVMATKR